MRVLEATLVVLLLQCFLLGTYFDDGPLHSTVCVCGWAHILTMHSDALPVCLCTQD